MRKDPTEGLTKELRERLQQVKFADTPENIGWVIESGDGVVHLAGLSQVATLEMIIFENGEIALTLNLEVDNVGAIVLGDYRRVKVGDRAKSTGKLLSIPVGAELIGRVIDPLGRVLDGQGDYKVEKYYPIEKVAPGVIYRQPVDTPLQTGIKAIDSMIPIGRGQRELIIGDRKTGKTALAVDTIINQKGQNMVCVYVAIGQKTSSVALLIDTLRKYKALAYTIVVVASAKDPAALQYLAPYVGCAIGEYFMDQGKDALVIYDDLTKHAWAYREVSLILRRPSGREAYPGDVFYLHSRLLERACHLDQQYGGGSLTALPIVETQAGDVSAYIPTNVISITDGQIFLDTDLFNAGIRPAINVGISVSRVGGAAQTRAMKQVAGKLRLELAQYRELAAFVQFASELDLETRKRIERGERTTQLLKQEQYQPFSLAKQVASIWAAGNGFVDDIAVDKVRDFEQKYLDYIEEMHGDLLEKIAQEKRLSQEFEEKLRDATVRFKSTYKG